jgi:hypothetical protein
LEATESRAETWKIVLVLAGWQKWLPASANPMAGALYDSDRDEKIFVN